MTKAISNLFDDRNMKSDYVYFLLAHKPGTYRYNADGAKYVKIGVATDPEERVRNFDTGNAMDLNIWTVTRGGYALESKLHNYLKKYKVRNKEWFRASKEVIEVVLNAPNDYEPKNPI